MANNTFEIKMFDDEYVCFSYKSIIVCNKNIKNAILNNQVELEAPSPYIIVTNEDFSDDKVEILEDASFADCLSLYKSKPAFGGVIV